MNLAEGLAIVAGSRPGGTVLPGRAGCPACRAAVAARIAPVEVLAPEDVR
jgi:hypothetical protein